MPDANVGHALPRLTSALGTLPWALVPSLLFAIGTDAAWAQTHVIIDDTTAASARFIGFGAEWDAAGYTQSGVTDRDYQVIEKRIRWMRLPVVRKAILTRWALVADGVFDFETQEMRDLYRQLVLSVVTVHEIGPARIDGVSAGTSVQGCSDPGVAFGDR